MEGLAKIAMLNQELANIHDKKTRVANVEQRLQKKLEKITREMGDENMKKAGITGIKQKTDNHEILLNEQMLSKLAKAKESEKRREEFLKFLANEPGAIKAYVRFVTQ